MKKRYGNRQNMMAVFMTFAVPQLFLGLMFKRLTFGEKLLFILAVSLRERLTGPPACLLNGAQRDCVYARAVDVLLTELHSPLQSRMFLARC